MTANSRDRSKHIPIKHNAKTESFKRPNHIDFMTSSELKKIEFTGVRENGITKDFEFWIKGGIVKTVSRTMISIDPDALVKAHAEVFKL